MQSLNTFKLPNREEEPVNTNLDTMLGDLQEDMVKQGIRPTPKGICSACEQPIMGQVVTAMGKTFHTEHFTCAKCNQVELFKRSKKLAFQFSWAFKTYCLSTFC